MKKKQLAVIFICLFSFLIASLHFLIFRGQSPHVILEELFYVPLLLGAFVFGLKGSLLTYMLISILYVPFFFGQWSGTALELTDRLLHLVFTGLVAFMAGIVADRVRKQHRQREQDRYLAGIGQAAATIVHDLRNPLIVIQAFAKRIKEKEMITETAILPIIESAENMQEILDSVRDFSRPFRMELKRGDVRDIALRACRSCRAKAEEKGVTLSTEFPPQSIFLDMDEIHLERAFANLIHNSLDASEKGQSIRVSLSAEKKSVVARIKDSGSGMDRETLDNIFIPFYSRKTAGTGLGMPMVKKVVDGHQGIIRVQSQPGQGTEVIITLPCSRPVPKGSGGRTSSTEQAGQPADLSVKENKK